MTNLTKKAILNQSIDYSTLKLKQYFRINKLKLGFGLLFLSIYSFVFGIILVFLFLYSNNTNILFRSLFASTIIMFYITLLIYSLISSAMGAKNPFLSNRSDAIFQLLIPVNPFVSYLSLKISNAIRDLFITIVVSILLFYPLMIVLNGFYSYDRLIYVILNFFFGIELVSLIGNLIYLILQRLRVGKNWSILYAEQSILIGGIVIAVPILFIYLFISDNIPSYQALSKYSLIPFINIAVGNVGFFFRSGIPLYSFISVIYSLLQILILFSIDIIVIKATFSTAELGDILPVLEYFENQREMTLEIMRNTLVPTIDEVEKNENFYSKFKFVSLIKKEWVFYKRTSEFKTNFIFVFVLVILTFSLNVL